MKRHYDFKKSTNIYSVLILLKDSVARLLTKFRKTFSDKELILKKS